MIDIIPALERLSKSPMISMACIKRWSSFSSLKYLYNHPPVIIINSGGTYV
jgi:hypothetical protein